MQLLNMAHTDHVLDRVRSERSFQDGRWKVQNHSIFEWLGILTEEVGEVAKDMLRFRFGGPDGEQECFDDLVFELVQVAAVAVVAIESLERNYPDYTPFSDIAASPHTGR